MLTKRMNIQCLLLARPASQCQVAVIKVGASLRDATAAAQFGLNPAVVAVASDFLFFLIERRAQNQPQQATHST